MAVYKLLRGMHAEGRGTERRIYKRGALVESDVNLEERFGSEKFRKMGESKKRAVREEPEDDEPEDDEDDDLEGMTVLQLKELAENEEINIEGLKVKADIIDRIRETR